jgi:hypothetical protein
MAIDHRKQGRFLALLVPLVASAVLLTGHTLNCCWVETLPSLSYGFLVAQQMQKKRLLKVAADISVHVRLRDLREENSKIYRWDLDRLVQRALTNEEQLERAKEIYH